MMIIICSLFLAFLPASYAISCKNSNGKDVDWFVGLKLPKVKDASLYGHEFLYVDQNSKNWSTPQDIRQKSSAIGQTLAQLYGKNKDKFYVLYNDHPPKEKAASSSRAHAKGVVYFDRQAGFWLIHSAPRFPPANKYEYPPTAIKNGQSFLCITMRASQLKALGTQLLYMYPNIYHSNLPTTIAKEYPELQILFSDNRLKNYIRTVEEKKSVKKMKSIKNMSFVSLVKSREFRKDLYSELVAPYLKSEIWVETWRNGGKNLESVCRKPAVKNILALVIGTTTFSTTKDHSKWAVTVGKNRKSDTVCIGDINRQPSQFKRGGGTACFENKLIHKLFENAVNKYEKC